MATTLAGMSTPPPLLPPPPALLDQITLEQSESHTNETAPSATRPTMSSAIKIVALALPALAFVLVTIWMSSVLTSYSKVGDNVTANKLAGFSWAKGDGHVFNWHPVLMTFGFVFCSTISALGYVSLPFSHKTNKVIHMSAHAIGAITAFVGAIAVFRFHNEHNITNLYSLHSWLGVLTWVFFVAQWVFSFTTFYYPGARPQFRATVISYHVGVGIGILALIYMTAATGVLEKLAFNASCNVAGNLNGVKVAGYMAPDCVLGNIIGLVLALSFIVAVTVIVHAKIAQTQQIPTVRGETSPLVNNGAAAKHNHTARGYHA